MIIIMYKKIITGSLSVCLIEPSVSNKIHRKKIQWILPTANELTDLN